MFIGLFNMAAAVGHVGIKLADAFAGGLLEGEGGDSVDEAGEAAYCHAPTIKTRMLHMLSIGFIDFA